MKMNATVTWTTTLSATVLALATGCAKGEALGDDYDTEAVLETEGIILPDGHEWCVRAVDAKVDVIGGPDRDIKDSDDGNNWVKGCTCVSADEHTAFDILDGNNDNIVTIDDMQSDDLISIRNAARQDAEINCEAVADADFGGAVWADNCAAEVDNETSMFLNGGDPSCDPAERIGTGDGEMDPPTDEYDDYYSLNNVIVNTSGNNYTIDDTFFYDVMDNPGWLLDDTTRIVYDSTNSPPYKFTMSGTSDIAYKLGLRNNDRPVSINGYTLSGGMLDALVAYGALKTSTSFSFVVKRSGSNTSFNYTVQ